MKLRLGERSWVDSVASHPLQHLRVDVIVERQVRRGRPVPPVPTLVMDDDGEEYPDCGADESLQVQELGRVDADSDVETNNGATSRVSPLPPLPHSISPAHLRSGLVWRPVRGG